MSLKCFSIVAEDIVAVNYFEQNCKVYHLTSREMDIVKLLEFPQKTSILLLQHIITKGFT